MTVQQMAFVKRWTLRDFGYSVDSLREIVSADKDASVDLVTVLGLVTDMKTEINKLDADKTNVRFAGQFEMNDLLTGKKINALQAFFPGDAEAFVEAFKGASEGAVKVAFVIAVKHDKGAPGKVSATGYKFSVKPFVEKSASNDIFAEFRALLPKPVTKTVDVAETAAVGDAPTGAATGGKKK